MHRTAVVALMALVSTPPMTVAGEAVRADDGAAIAKLAKKTDAAIVTIKHILKVDGGGDAGSSDEEMELSAVMIEPTGLVLCANSLLLGQAGLAARFQPEAGISVTPTDIKVLIGDDAEGVKAKVLSRDTDLDLAWIQIEEPAAAPYAFVDLKNAAEGVVGQSVVTAARTGGFFDHAFVFDEGMVRGTTTKPRNLIIASGFTTQPGNPNNRAGMPVLTPDGRVLGVAVLQLPAPEDLQAASGDGSDWQNGFDHLVLPAADVLKATERTKELAASGAAPAEGDAAAAPEEKPAGDAEPK